MGRIYIYKNPRTPFRKLPKGVNLHLVEPPQYVCAKCREYAKEYSDGVIWCDKCGGPKEQSDLVNLRRGRSRVTPTPEWKRINVD